MDKTPSLLLESILKNPAMLSRDGQYTVVEEMARQTDSSAILSRLSLVERIRLYAFLASSQNPDIQNVTPEAYHEIVSMVGNYIDLKQNDAIGTAMQVAIGRQKLREKQEVPESNNNDFDGFQSGTERWRQLYLAYVVSSFLPAAIKKNAGDFTKTNLSETEQGALIAILSIERSDKDTTVQNAFKVACENVTLTPTIWNSFQSTCAELDKTPKSLTEKTSALVDRIVEREIRRLSPNDIAQLDDEQAYRYIQALGWSGVITPSFRETQLYLYQNLNPTHAIQAYRQEQIDATVDHFSNMTAEQFEEWQHLKKGWTEKSSAEKTDALTRYVESFGTLIGIPQAPQVSVVPWADAPAKPKSKANGYFLGWENTTVDNKSTFVWTNKIVLVDDTDDYGRPLSVSQSLRSALSTTTHESLHSDDTQTIVRLGYNQNKAKIYAASFEDGTKPSNIQLSDPLGCTASILHNVNGGRTTYVSPETNYEIYRQQPFEKYAWSFQNEFTAALNGALVLHQVNTNARNLQAELKSLFQKVGQVLSARQELTGDSTDIVPLKNYERSEHPFGALTWRDSEAVENGVAAENGSSNYVSVDFSQFNGRAEVLTYLQDSLKKLDANRDSTQDDYIPLFKQSADFLIQMPNEIWAIKKKLGPDDKALADKLDMLATKTQELGEDMSDYSFLLTRKKEIETRRAAEAQQKSKRKRVASKLAATL